MVVSVLNRLLQTLCRSLALYVEEIKPWSLAGHEPVWTAIGRLAADSRMYSQRVAEAIVDTAASRIPGLTRWNSPRSTTSAWSSFSARSSSTSNATRK